MPKKFCQLILILFFVIQPIHLQADTIESFSGKFTPFLPIGADYLPTWNDTIKLSIVDDNQIDTARVAQIFSLIHFYAMAGNAGYSVPEESDKFFSTKVETSSNYYVLFSESLDNSRLIERLQNDSMSTPENELLTQVSKQSFDGSKNVYFKSNDGTTNCAYFVATVPTDKKQHTISGAFLYFDRDLSERDFNNCLAGMSAATFGVQPQDMNYLNNLHQNVKQQKAYVQTPLFLGLANVCLRTGTRDIPCWYFTTDKVVKFLNGFLN